MKRIILALAASLAVLIGGTLPAAAAALPVTHWRFWTGNICMAIGDTSYNYGAVAAKWNTQSHGLVNIVSANNCVTAGYPPSRRFTVSREAFSPTGTCWKVTNIDKYTLLPNRDGNLNPNNPSSSEYLYSNNPRVILNSACVNGANYPHHAASAAIGELLGLDWTNSSGYNSRVMNMTAYSWANIPYPDANSGSLLNFLYSGHCNASADC